MPDAHNSDTLLLPVGPPGQCAHYAVTGLDALPDQNVVKLRILLGDTDIVKGIPYQWVHLHGTKQNGQAYTVSALVDGWPGRSDVRTARYLLREADDPAREYVHALTDEGFPPEQRSWDILFPKDVQADDGPFAERVHYLGHDYERTEVRQEPVPPIPPTERISLRPDVRIGTGRSVRDVRGGRLEGEGDYEYVRHSREDIEELISAGFNHFWAAPEQYGWVEHRPVFSVHPRQDDRYPELLYRSNMIGGHAYFDEPGIRARRQVRPEQTPSEMARLVVDLTLARPPRTGALHRALAGREDIDLGDLYLHHPLPNWETAVSTVWYPMRTGATGSIHEGRYAAFREPPALNFHYGCQIPPYPEYILRYYYAFLRGAARHFGGDWGVAIYGQMEAQMAPRVLTLAYDMGARYFWFWTSDHGHHVPYPEQVDLARLLSSHAHRNPHRDMDALLHAAKTAIVLPEGYTFESSGLLYNNPAHHMERLNEAGVRYRDILHNAAVEMERLLRLGIDFDFAVDSDGFTGRGYEELIYIRTDSTVSIVRGHHEESRKTPRTPPRPGHRAALNIEADVKRDPQDTGKVRLLAAPAGGSPPYGFDTSRAPYPGEYRRCTVQWEHYGPDGEYELLQGPEHALDLAPGRHRLRAGTADSYGQIADRWFDVEVPK